VWVVLVYKPVKKGSNTAIPATNVSGVAKKYTTESVMRCRSRGNELAFSKPLKLLYKYIVGFLHPNADMRRGCHQIGNMHHLL